MALVANEERELLTRRHSVFGVTGCVLVVVTFLVATPNPSIADTAPSTLCDGYVACSTGSFTTHGYPAHAGSSYWRMYAGNNCTNYVAYVESTAFGAATPPNLLGDADQWPTNALRDGALVNHTPTVGSVAEWNPGSPGIPSPGHVAVVERVGPDQSYIVISEQNILDANDYAWVKINADSSLNQWQQWPSNFIHFPTGEQATPPTTSPRVVEVVVRVATDGPRNAGFEFLDGRDQIVTPDLTTDLTLEGHSDGYDIAPRDVSLRHHYALHVSVKGPDVRVVRQGGPDASSTPRIRFTAVGKGHAPVVVTISLHLVVPHNAIASVVSAWTTTAPDRMGANPALSRMERPTNLSSSIKRRLSRWSK